MGLYTGLAKLQEIADSATESSDRRKFPWFGIKDKESARIKFLQEFDPDSPGYDEKYGLCGVLLEHSAPKDFKRKALCSMEDEGQCLPCELYARGIKEWKPKMRFYANVLVIPDKGEPEVQVISQGIGKGSIYPTLLGFYNDNGPITPHTFRISRAGSQFNNTSYTLNVNLKTVEVDTSDLEVYDIYNEVGLHIPYERQRNFYLVDDDDNSDDEPLSPAASFNEDEWV
jgi:hypothetical protein